MYKKYFTMSFDDGITQDARIIGILKKYGVPCTFNINTGLFGARWDWVGEVLHKPGLLHLRFTEEEIKSGIYNGFDVEVHTANHPSLGRNYGDNAAKVIEEIVPDAAKITQLTGIEPCGMAWPGGLEADTSPLAIKTILENSPVRFARLAVSNENAENFGLPDEFMMWYPSVCIGDINKSLYLAEKFIAAKPLDSDLLFYLWGHGYDIDANNTWPEFEKIVKMMGGADDVVCVSNAEFYSLFKDRIPSYKGFEQ